MIRGIVKYCLIIGSLVISVSSARAAEQTAVFAGGCFWGVEAVFEHVTGVVAVRSGYSGGSKETADYETVSAGETKHAESVEVRFDDSKVTYEQLLYVFFRGRPRSDGSGSPRAGCRPAVPFSDLL